MENALQFNRCDSFIGKPIRMVDLFQQQYQTEHGQTEQKAQRTANVSHKLVQIIAGLLLIDGHHFRRVVNEQLRSRHSIRQTRPAHHIGRIDNRAARLGASAYRVIVGGQPVREIPIRMHIQRLPHTQLSHRILRHQLTHRIVIPAVRPLRLQSRHPWTGAADIVRHTQPLAGLGTAIEPIQAVWLARIVAAGQRIEMLCGQLDFDLLVDAHEHVLAATGRLHVDFGERFGRLVQEHVPARRRAVVVIGDAVVPQPDREADLFPGAGSHDARHDGVTAAILEEQTADDVDI